MVGLMPVKQLLICLFLICVPIVADMHAAEPQIADFSGPLDSSGIPQPWRVKVNAGKPNIKLADSGVIPVVCVRSESASFSLERDFILAPSQIGLIRWEWKADALPRQGDVRHVGRNDQVLQVMLAFEGRRIISYIWDSNAPVGTVLDESLPWPLALEIKVVVVTSGESARGSWVSVQRNLAADYRKLFGTAPSALRGIRLQTNTQHTASLGIGTFGPISFYRPQHVFEKPAP